MRWKVTQPLRAVVATVFQLCRTRPLRLRRWWASVNHYFAGLDAARWLRPPRAPPRDGLPSASWGRSVGAGKRALACLVRLAPADGTQTLAAEVLYDAQDPSLRARWSLTEAARKAWCWARWCWMTRACWVRSPVYPLTSEVTLVTDKDAAVPVLNARSPATWRGLWLAANPRHGLRFAASNPMCNRAICRPGSDGIYPAGMPVAKIVAVDRRADSAFARITLKPMARSGPASPCAVAATRIERICLSASGCSVMASSASPLRRSRKGARR